MLGDIMGIIVAIGGGSIRNLETLEIDKFIVKSTGIDNPKALFIPTASDDSLDYVEVFNKVYGEKLGCKTDTLLLLEDNLSQRDIENKILCADLIYVGGGNTKKMMEVWKSKKVDIYLENAFKNGTILAGLSAGAMCWFNYGYSDSNAFENEDVNWEFTKLKCLGFINAINCPHYNEEERKSFDEIMKNSDELGIALENNVAIVFKDNKYKIIKSDINADAYEIYNKGKGIIIKEKLINEEFIDIQKGD